MPLTCHCSSTTLGRVFPLTCMCRDRGCIDRDRERLHAVQKRDTSSTLRDDCFLYQVSTDHHMRRVIVERKKKKRGLLAQPIFLACHPPGLVPVPPRTRLPPARPARQPLPPHTPSLPRGRPARRCRTRAPHTPGTPSAGAPPPRAQRQRPRSATALDRRDTPRGVCYWEAGSGGVAARPPLRRPPSTQRPAPPTGWWWWWW